MKFNIAKFKDKKKMETSLSTYKKRLKDGYGLNYPDGHVIRLYEKYLKARLVDVNEPKVLDFGCWTGVHSNYFESKGFIPYGVDIVEDVVNSVKGKLPDYANNFHTITNSTNLGEVFEPRSFDLIFCNQSLYFLNEKDFKKRLSEFNVLLKPNGMLVATMMATKNYYSNYITNTKEDGISEVDLTNVLNCKHYIRFTESLEDLEQKFGVFEKILLGSYDINFNGNSGLHYIYLGQKIKE